MIVIAEFYARYASTLPEPEHRLSVENLLEFVERSSKNHYRERYEQFGITIVVRLEIGSTRVWITISAMVGILSFYGNIRQGVDYLRQDVDSLARLIMPGVSSHLGLPLQRPEYHGPRFGVPGHLHRLFTQVEQGEIPAQEATKRAVELLQRHNEGDVLDDVAGLEQQLSSEFENVEHQFRRRRREVGLETAVDQSEPVKRVPQLPRRPEPLVAAMPGTPFRRRRRRGVMASRDRQTGHLQITLY